MKAISSLISAVLVVAFTVATGSILILYFPSLIKTSTSNTESYIQRARSCAGGDFEIYYTKACKENLKKGLVLWLKLDEGSGSIAEDSSRYGNNGSISGATWTIGKLGNGLEFDGENDYVEIPFNKSLNTTSITISLWFESLGKTGEQELVDHRGGAQSGYNLRISGSEFPIDLIWIVGGWPDERWLSVSDVIESNTWYHVVATYDFSTGEQKLYLNSLEIASQNTNKDISGSPESIVLGSVIGHNGYFFNGTIDEVRIYNRALSEDEIKALYYEGLTNKFNVTFYMLNKGIANLGKNFTCLLILDNGSSLTKKFGLSNSFGINNPYAQISVNFDGYYPNYGLIDKIKVCSVECIDMCAEIKKEIEC